MNNNSVNCQKKDFDIGKLELYLMLGYNTQT